MQSRGLPLPLGLVSSLLSWKKLQHAMQCKKQLLRVLYMIVWYVLGGQWICKVSDQRPPKEGVQNVEILLVLTSLVAANFFLNAFHQCKKFAPLTLMWRFEHCTTYYVLERVDSHIIFCRRSYQIAKVSREFNRASLFSLYHFTYVLVRGVQWFQYVVVN